MKSDETIYSTQTRRAYVYIFPGKVWQKVVVAVEKYLRLLKREFYFIFYYVVKADTGAGSAKRKKNELTKEQKKKS